MGPNDSTALRNDRRHDRTPSLERGGWLMEWHELRCRWRLRLAGRHAPDCNERKQHAVDVVPTVGRPWYDTAIVRKHRRSSSERNATNLGEGRPKRHGRRRALGVHLQRRSLQLDERWKPAIDVARVI